MFILMLRKSREEEEIEAMYIRKRFQGLTLEDQRRMQAKRKKKRERRRSSATESKASKGSQLTPSRKNPKITSANPFGLQDWQLKLSGIDMDVDTEETDIDGDEEARRPMGALNPLLMVGVEDTRADYDAVEQPQTRRHSHPHSKTQLGGKVSPPRLEETGSEDSNSAASDDSFNPYD